jgi:hypothetical protein
MEFHVESPQYSPPVGAEELLWRRGMVVMENVSAPRDAELLAGLLGKGLTPEVLMRIPKRSCTESIRISQHTSDQSYSMNSRAQHPFLRAVVLKHTTRLSRFRQPY